MDCPKCDSDNIEITDEFDQTNIDKDECCHDFRCNDCGCLFQIVYAPISTQIIGQSEEICPEEEEEI